MTSCQVNTDGCHVHVDVRPGGPQSRIVTVTGTVQDSTEKRLPGVVVRLAGMPARTNARGMFALKHVVTPRQYELEVDAPNQGAVIQPVDLSSGAAKVEVRIPVQPQATLTARLEGVKRWKEVAALQVVVRNAGFAPAVALKLEAAPPPSLRVQAVQPDAVPLLQPGAETRFTLRLIAPPTMADAAILAMGIPLTARYQTAAGQIRVRSINLYGEPAPETTAAALPLPQAMPKGRLRAARGLAGAAGSDGAALLGGLLAGALAGALHARVRRRPAFEPLESDSAEPQPAADPAVLRLEKEGRIAP
jgi:hypothetical protein